jgi:predicted ferric reductase
MASQPPTTPPPAGAPTATAGAGPAALPPEHRYRSLRIIATLLTVFGWVVLILGGLGVIGFTVFTGQQQGVPQALGVLVVGAIYVALFALYAFAGAAIIRLFMAVEENTRLTAEALASGRR